MNKILTFLNNTLNLLNEKQMVVDEDLKKVIYIYLHSENLEEKIISEIILNKIDKNIKIKKEKIDYDKIAYIFTNKNIRNFLYKRKE